MAHRDLASSNVRNAAESGQTRTDADDPKPTRGMRLGYSTTSSARPSSILGNVKPSALAVLMLMTS